MVILHIAAIENNPFNGVCVAVPQHIIAQKEHAVVGFINIKNIEIDDLQVFPGTQMEYIKPFDVNNLPEPFNKPDLVVFHECYRPDYLKIARNIEKNKIPYVDVPHGELRIEAQHKKHLKKVVANILLFNRFVNHAEAIQCLSEAELRATNFKVEKFLGTNGVLIPSERKKTFSEDGVKFIYIGRYEWRVKGLDLLFEAIRMNADYLRQNHCSFELYGPDILGRLAEVTQLVKNNNIEDLVSLNLEIMGDVKKEKLLESDVFIQTSRHEGMPMGILEAMSYGIPCMVSEGTTLAMKISEAGAGWNAGSTANDISAAIKQVLTDKNKWEDYGKNGRSLVSDEFSWSVVANQIIEQYSKIVTNNQRTGN